MKKIQIFLASSITDLHGDRNRFEAFVQETNDILIDHGLRIERFCCEYADSAIQMQGMQNTYNEWIRRPCDLFLNLYHTKAGKYTVEELDTALEVRKRCGKPVILIGFRKPEGGSPDASLAPFRKRADGLSGCTVFDYADFGQVRRAVLQALPAVCPEIDLRTGSDGSCSLFGSSAR